MRREISQYSSGRSPKKDFFKYRGIIAFHSDRYKVSNNAVLIGLATRTNKIGSSITKGIEPNREGTRRVST